MPKAESKGRGTLTGFAKVTRTDGTVEIISLDDVEVVEGVSVEAGRWSAILSGETDSASDVRKAVAALAHKLGATNVHFVGPAGVSENLTGEG